MYLKDVIIENIGPITRLDIELPFHNNGAPKPLILVGENGSGKTTILSAIVDALHEVANQVFDDILEKKGLGYSYFKLLGPINQKSGTVYGFDYLRFMHGENVIEYIDKTGKLNPTDATEKTRRLLNLKNNWEEDGNYKAITDIKEATKKEVQAIFLQNSYCFFPSNRYENPHWLNEQKENERFNFSTKISSRLNKPIVIDKVADFNKSWLLDVFLDSRAEIEPNPNLENSWLAPDIKTVILFKNIRTHVDTILSCIFGKEVLLAINHRGHGSARLKITDQHKIEIIPSLDNLSLGQAVLFHLFLTILRYSDINSINKTLNIDSIKGVVIIDEIDVHSHVDMQKKVLPALIKLFPNVQFVITTHSPLFLLGMREIFGDDGFEVRTLPDGNIIDVEAFKEFQHAYECFAETNKHKKELTEFLNSHLEPIIFVEGTTDVDYIKKAAEFFDKTNLLGKVNSKAGDDIFLNDGGGAGNLGKIYNAFNTQLSLVIPHKILLLYDCDTKKQGANKNNLFTRKIQSIDGNPIKKGIENLLPASTIEKAKKYNASFFDVEQEHSVTKAGIKDTIPEKISINENQKRNLCDWLCNHGTAEDFVHFEQVFKIFDEVFNEES